MKEILQYKILKKILNIFIHSFYFSAIKGRLLGPKLLMNSLPKSGTNLLEQVLLHLPYMRRRVRHTLCYWDGNYTNTLQQIEKIRKGEFLVAHLTWDYKIQQIILQNNIKNLIMIRDPRDIVVSHFNYVTYIDKTHVSHQYFKSLSDDDARLMAVINGVDGIVESIDQMLERCKPWLTCDEVLVVRFEHLIGARGGGCDQLQRRTVSDIARYLNICIDEIQLNSICSKIYSETSPTFRNPQIGNWENVFKPEHITAFMQRAERYLEYYDYPATSRQNHNSQ